MTGPAETPEPATPDDAPSDVASGAPELAQGGAATRLATSVSTRGIDPEPDDAGVPHSGLRFAALLGGLALIGFLNIWMLIVIAALVVMIGLHELGHYLTAKRAGMKVTEFFLFFGPKVWSFRRGETEYGIKCIPAGAYVKIIGMHNLEEVPAHEEGRTYRQKTFGQRLSVAVAGSTMHFLLALGLIFVALAAIGQPAGTLDPDAQMRDWQIETVIPGSGAAEAGLGEGDRITAIDGAPIRTFDDLREAVEAAGDEPVPVSYLRDGDELTTQVAVRPYTFEGQASSGLGVVRGFPESQRLAPLEAAVNTPGEFVNVTRLSVQALGNFFTPSGVSDFAGQVGSAQQDRAVRNDPAATAADQEPSENRLLSIYGLVRIGAGAGEVNPAGLIVLFALVNVFIGVFNLAPLLPFDGGHVAIAVYEKVQEKRLNRRRYFTNVTKLLPLTYLVVIALAMLFFSTLYLDIANPLVLQ
jgi:membrane-associated protease RseP (regulator of RpoE activity)